MVCLVHSLHAELAWEIPLLLLQCNCPVSLLYHFFLIIFQNFSYELPIRFVHNYSMVKSDNEIGKYSYLVRYGMSQRNSVIAMSSFCIHGRGKGAHCFTTFSFNSCNYSHWRHRTTEGAKFWITCKRLGFLSSLSRLQVIQNERTWCTALAYVTAGYETESKLLTWLHFLIVAIEN